MTDLTPAERMELNKALALWDGWKVILRPDAPDACKWQILNPKGYLVGFRHSEESCWELHGPDYTHPDNAADLARLRAKCRAEGKTKQVIEYWMELPAHSNQRFMGDDCTYDGEVWAEWGVFLDAWDQDTVGQCLAIQEVCCK